MATGEPLSDARLAEIRENADDVLQWGPLGSSVSVGEMADAAIELLAEVDLLRTERAALLADFDDLLGLAMAVAHGWPRETAPEHIREGYIDALKTMARHLVSVHRERVAVLRARNAAELEAEPARPDAPGRE